MTLFIAFAILWHGHAEWYWYVLAFIVWICHLAYVSDGVTVRVPGRRK
jgi:hypothetical protein